MDDTNDMSGISPSGASEHAHTQTMAAAGLKVAKMAMDQAESQGEAINKMIQAAADVQETSGQSDRTTGKGGHVDVTA